jgi:DNA-binding beta-propeller fold protein YncE
MQQTIKRISLFTIAIVTLVLAGCSTVTAQAVPVRYAYVANAADGTVSAIDLASDEVAWTLPIGERAAHGIAASPDGNIVYAGDAASQEVVIIDAQRQSIVKRIPLAHGVHGIDIAPDGQTVWVGGALDNDPVLGTLSVLDTASNIVVDVISPGLGSASHFAFTPDGQEVWIASTSTNLVWIVNTSSRQVTAAVPLTIAAQAQRPVPGDDWGAYLAERRIIGLNEVAIAPDGRRAYAVGPTTSQLYAVDVKQRQVVNSVAAGERAHGVTVSPDSKEVWIADWSGMVSVFDAESLEQLARIQVVATGDDGGRGPGANHVAFSRDGRQVYVTGINDVAVIDAQAREVTGRMEVGQEPHELSLEDWVAPGASIDTEAILAAAQGVSPTGTSPSTTASRPAALLPAGDGTLTRVNHERAVTVEVTPLNLDGSGATVDFQVVLDTHAVELDYDLVQLSILRDDQGNEYAPVGWEGGQGGHHMSGILRFENAGQILKPGRQYLELELQEIAQVPSRHFRWEFEQ